MDFLVELLDELIIEDLFGIAHVGGHLVSLLQRLLLSLNNSEHASELRTNFRKIPTIHQKIEQIFYAFDW